MLSHPSGLFQETTFQPFMVLAHQIFTHPTTPVIVFSVGLGAPGGLKLGSAPYF